MQEPYTSVRITYIHSKDNSCSWIFLVLFFYIELWTEKRNRSTTHFSHTKSLWVYTPLMIKQNAVRIRSIGQKQVWVICSLLPSLPHQKTYCTWLHLIPVYQNKITIVALTVLHIIRYPQSSGTWILSFKILF